MHASAFRLSVASEFIVSFAFIVRYYQSNHVNNEATAARLSKFLSLLLRHRPEVIGLQLDEKGWADVSELLDKMNAHGHVIDLRLLEHIVVTNNKSRFSLSTDGKMIRANQGHSISVALDLTPLSPPDLLYHGTAETTVPLILEAGIERRSRQHVHLSTDIATARAVGSRHGRPAVLEVQAGRMHEDGFQFFCSDNGVWLTERVPTEYLQPLPVR